MESTFLTAAVAEQAVEHFRKAMLAFIADHQKKGLHVVVLNPAARYTPGMTELRPEDILYELSLRPEFWDGSDYRKIARAKALLSLREQMNSGDVPRHSLVEGDVKWRGSICLRGLIVAISGLDGVDDESFSFACRNRAERIALKAFEEWDAVNDRVSFV